MTVNRLKESTFIPDMTFPINVFYVRDIPLHWHDHMEWIIVKEGRTCVQIDDTFVHLEKGEFAFVNSQQLHGAHSLDEHTKCVAIVFNEAIIRNSGLDHTDFLYFEPYLNNRSQLPNFIKSDHPFVIEFKKLIENLIDEFEQKKPGFELFIKSELFRIFGMIFRYYHQLEESPVSHIQKKYNLSHLLNYLRENFKKELSVKDAAQMVNLSSNHFCYVFKKVTGKTLIEYIQHLRVNEAERLLIESEDTVTEIAEKVGFQSITYFGRVFKKYKKTSPSSLRKMH